MRRPFMPRRGDLRGALPGLLVMVLIAMAGYFVARGVGELLPDDFLASAPWEDVTVEDIELDPATGLPIVPTSLDDEVITWSPVQPNSRIDPANTWASEVPAGAPDPERPAVTLLATYPTFEDALAVAQELARAVGDPEAEARWLEAAGVTSSDGFGWVGPAGSSTPFVQVVDRRLLVDGLEWREAYEPLPAERPEGAAASAESVEPQEAAAYGAPLALALEGSATSVLVEGDRWGEGAIAFDLVCIGDESPLQTLGQELADAPYARPDRPPWIAPALTFEEGRARRTERLVAQLWASAFIRDVMRSDEMERLSGELAQAREAGDTAAMVNATDAMQAHLAELVPRNLPDLGALADALDADQLAATAAELSGVPAEADAPTASSARDGGASYAVLAEGRRLWVTLGSWFGIGQGFGPFVQHLDANGCDDIRVVFHDYDDVRGD